MYLVASVRQCALSTGLHALADLVYALGTGSTSMSIRLLEV